MPGTARYDFGKPAARRLRVFFSSAKPRGSLNMFGRYGKIFYFCLANSLNNVYSYKKRKNEKVLISVKDSGIGIPAESIKKIWDRFYKTDLSRGKDKRGTGLGLAIVKEIIQAHNEHINVISTEGVGTEFIFTLPLAKKEVQS